MKKALIIGFSAFALAACGNSAQTLTQSGNNTNMTAPQNANSLIVSSHSSDKTPGANKPPQNGASQPQTEGPMAKPIDVSELTKNIELSEKAHKESAKDVKTKLELANAYFARAFALTEAAQYRAALGDFRKGLKLEPDNKDAKAMHDRIISIFRDLNRELPKEGEEPPPLPFKKS